MWQGARKEAFKWNSAQQGSEKSREKEPLVKKRLKEDPEGVGDSATPAECNEQKAKGKADMGVQAE